MGAIEDQAEFSDQEENQEEIERRSDVSCHCFIYINSDKHVAPDMFVA